MWRKSVYIEAAQTTKLRVRRSINDCVALAVVISVGLSLSVPIFNLPK